MKRRVEDWTVEKLHKARATISFPEYQRQPNLWSVEKKRLLIDSILNDIDIPKLYFNETKDGGLEVVDGQQRLWAIWEFLDEEYTFRTGNAVKRFSELSQPQKDTIRKYKLQITILEDAEDDYLRELFLRLQLGLLLVTGEKLHAATGAMKDFVFETLAAHGFIRGLSIPQRRYARETLGAQLSINSFTRAKVGSFARTRYEDLLFFFTEYQHPTGADLEFFKRQSKSIVAVLGELSAAFGARTGELTNRSYVLSIYLLFEDLRTNMSSPRAKETFVKFAFALWKRLKQEVDAGIDRKNRELYAFETMLSSAPGEKYQIERRHQKLIDYYEHFISTGKVKGDK